MERKIHAVKEEPINKSSSSRPTTKEQQKSEEEFWKKRETRTDDERRPRRVIIEDRSKRFTDKQEKKARHQLQERTVKKEKSWKGFRYWIEAHWIRY